MSEIIDGWNKNYETKDESVGAVSNSPARTVVGNLNGNRNNIGYGVTGYSGSVSVSGTGYLGYNGFDTTAAPGPYTLGTIYRQGGS